MAVKPKTNWLLLVGAALMLIIAATVGMLSLTGDNTPREEVAGDGPVRLEDSPEADTIEDTFRALRGDTLRVETQVDEVLTRNEEVLAENTEIQAQRQAEIERLEALVQSGQDKVQSDAQAFTQSLSEQIDTLTGGFQERISELENRLAQTQTGDSALDPADLGAAQPQYRSGDRVPGTEATDVVFVQALDQRAAGALIESSEAGTVASVTDSTLGLASGGLLNRSTGGAGGVEGGEGEGPRFDPNVRADLIEAQRPAPAPEIAEPKAEPEPYYTIPDLSVLGRANAVTALYGKVYLDQDVTNPAPLKIIIGRRNLAANMKHLPGEIEGMLFEGYAVGDRTGACVTGTLTVASFIFNDGTIRPAYIGDPGTRPENEAYRQDSLGYLSDPWGNPCIPGEIITDFAEQVTVRSILGSAEGFARALRQQEIESSVFTGEGGDPVLLENVTGSAARFAAASGAAEGISETSEFLKEFYGDISVAYYVPAGVSVDVHLQQELRLDKDPDARLIRYTRGPGPNRGLD